MLSFLDKFLKYTTTFALEIEERSGGSVTWESCDELVPNAGVDAPKPEPNVLVAARALLACAFPGRLLMAKDMRRDLKCDRKERR